MLPDIEQSAGEAFRTVPELAWLADEGNVSVERHRILIRRGACLVAADNQDRPVGLLSATVEGDVLHIWELDVRLELQGMGIGRSLLERAVENARQLGVAAITLTTFRDVAWNAPFYRRFGFRILEGAGVDERLTGLLLAEARHGMPAERRCAMRLDLGPAAGATQDIR
ncbi:GNAT family N-acetyltransferase [Mesorhizobium sp. ES1-1]|uniref:GNAT family N-acetyltransferase n=1 Tax=Mesorhizobium sp. ES1-1 TaxID=2876629 RepID=UPI001CCDC710|nr:GNAT family N-acetyltransferase [Mesorhizobium sp. ES1-1]MBZ9674861.1 GNAT family N-acetyltransferase [Mesorhizobium sp. ES1-1]